MPDQDGVEWDAMAFNWDDDRRLPDPKPPSPRGRVENAVTALLLVVVIAAIGAVLFFLLLVEQTGINACSSIELCDLPLLSLTTWIIPAIIVFFTAVTIVVTATRWRTSRSSTAIPALEIGVTVVGFLVTSALVRVSLQGVLR